MEKSSNHFRNRDSDIKLVGVTDGKPFPLVAADSVLLSSGRLGWRGIVVERQRLAAQEMPRHYVRGHGLMISAAERPVVFGWREDDRWHERQLNPGEFHLITDGGFSAPRWPETFETVTVSLDPRFVADVASDGLPADRIEFATQRAVFDWTVARYAEAFCSELESASSNGLLYAETLTIGFALHLLSNYAVAKPKIPLPRGKLNPIQLLRVVDFILSHLDTDVSLLTLAEQANVSPFHFARQFRDTVRLTPHQFVLRQRIQKSINLIRIGKLPLAQIAVEAGFYDQAQFTRAFRRVTGTTPAQYSRDR